MDHQPDLIHSLEQFGAALESMATILGDYYKALVTAGIPETLANQMVMEYHSEWVKKVLGR